ncbi:AAA family ATPase [Campylobacter vicugnae]|uniref:AAA family ATPase n=1 Tax=Campylobacter vicugnae TaxID=1660076 RepID=A0ABZ2E6D5_9BACT|nr:MULTISPECIES: AAA family ATPase [unclassified Campylobacter]
MQKVIIRNLGPIKESQIELKEFMVFIGDSGTGKSIILRTISLLKWIYKKMQYKAILKHSKINSDVLRFRLDRLLKNSMLDDFFTKDSYIEFIENGKSIVIIENSKLKPQYNNINTDTLLVGKIAFLNDIRSSLAEILSSPSGKRAKFSYYTYDMVENFYESLDHFKEFKLNSFDLTLTRKKRVGYESIHLVKDNKSIKFESASSGEKSISIIELICSYFANNYDFDNGFSNSLLELISQKIEIDNIVNLQEYIQKKSFKSFMSIFIEEPEVNLYPQKQQSITYFLSKIQKLQNRPQIILSTHSPYILTSLNNLLYAGMVANKIDNKNRVHNIVDKDYILNAKDFGAYLLEDGKAIDIIDKDTGLIDANRIDQASEDILNTFERLCEIDE